MIDISKYGATGTHSIKAVSVKWITDVLHLPLICTHCKKPLHSKGFKKIDNELYIPENQIVDNSLRQVFLLFHKKCKKNYFWAKKEGLT